MRRFVVLILAILFCHSVARAQVIDGFVTSVEKPTDLEIGIDHVLIDGSTHCQTRLLDSRVRLGEQIYDGLLSHHYPLLDSRPLDGYTHDLPCVKLPIFVGSHIRVSGNGNSQERTFTAEQLTLYVVQIRQTIVATSSYSECMGGALLEEDLLGNGQPVSSDRIMWLDGYPLTVNANTAIMTAPSTTELTYKSFGLFSTPRFGASVRRNSVQTTTVAALKPNMWATYRGYPLASGGCTLYNLRTWSNHEFHKERAFTVALAPSVAGKAKPSNIARTRGGDDIYQKLSENLVNDQNIQQFVSSVGESLVPTYQRLLAEDDDQKLHFRFLVIRSNEALVDKENARLGGISLLEPPSFHATVLAFPDGTVLIPDSTLARLRSKASLAAILAYAVTVIVQKQSYVARYSGLASAMQSGYQELVVFALARQQQALRIGIRQMFLAGYDIREAPFAWTAASGLPVTNPASSIRYPHKEASWYTSYTFDYISKFYQNVNFTMLESGQQEYSTVLAQLRKVDPSAFVQLD